ncbi:MAG TPA: ATP-binding protein [Sedimentisphaerales bacterium]|nr:ATP-binding protein [Sedimentisphaerales bacterium]
MGKKKAKKEAMGVRRKTAAGISVDVKVGILHTIADAIYSTPAGKVREAVANSRDNDAEWVIIVVDQTTRSIFICDNGSGITWKRFHEIFEAIGYGWGRDVVEQKLSYFGLGLMSIFQLGKKVEMFTRARGTNQTLKLEVDAEGIFGEENKKKSISVLKRLISLKKSNEASRKEASVSLVNETLAGEEFRDTWESFTEIIIRDMREEDFETICGDDFVAELRKWLPLKAERGEPFLKRLTGKKGREVRDLLENVEFCRTVDVYFGMQEDARIDQLWKYFPKFRSDVTFPDDNVYVGKRGGFAYYIVHSVAVDLHRDQRRGGDRESEREQDLDRKREADRETGFWVRNQNFLVKSADFLERSGPGRPRKFIDQPLRPWVYGEIFHKDMNRFLSVSRTDFLFDKKEFKEFREQVTQIVSPLNQELRDIYEKRKKIDEELVEPFRKLRGPKGGIVATEKRLREIIQHDGTEEQFRKDALAWLRKGRNKAIEREESRVDVLLRRSKRPLTLGQDEDAVVKIDPALKDTVDEREACEFAWDATNKRIVASLSPSLFEAKEVVFLGKTFEMVFVALKEADAGVSIDVDGGKVYVNPFNAQLAQYTVSIFDVYVALHIAKAISKTSDELVKNALALLGTKSEVSKKYITPLGDDLRRAEQLARRRA